MSANKLSYDKLKKELRKNYEKKTYDRLESYVRERVRIVYEKFTKLFVTLSCPDIFVSAFYEVL